MNFLVAASVVIALAGLFGTASAQERSPSRADPLTFESIVVAADELPVNVKIVDGVHWDPAGALKALAEHEALIANISFAHYLRGELAGMTKDYALSTKGYRRALELHESREDPLQPELVWATLDGLGGALLFARKLDEATQILERAVALGRAQHPKGWSQSLYNLACANSLRKRWGPAFAALREAIDVDPKWRASAKSDDDLAEARKRPEFVKLLGG